MYIGPCLPLAALGGLQAGEIPPGYKDVHLVESILLQSVMIDRWLGLCAGTVFKRFDPAKLFVLVGQDVTERFHLLLSLLFVVVEVSPSLFLCASRLCGLLSVTGLTAADCLPA